MTGFTAPPRGPETDAVIACLRAAKLLTGDATRPAGGGFPGGDASRPFVPYVVVYQGVTGQVDGPVADPFADTANEYQLTSVGQTRASASVIADRARTVLLAGRLQVPGRSVQLVSWTGQPARRDDDVTPPLFFAVDLYTVSTTPA